MKRSVKEVEVENDGRYFADDRLKFKVGKSDGYGKVVKIVVRGISAVEIHYNTGFVNVFRHVYNFVI